MVRLRLPALVVLLVALAACKGNSKPAAESESSAATVKDDSNAKAAEDLLAKRDALMKSRQTMQEERKKLEDERQTVIEQGGDTTEIDKKIEDQKAQEDQLSNQETALTDQMQAFLETAKDVTASGNAQQLVAARETSVANREKALASREDRVAQREADLASREKALAEREKNTCGAGGGTTTIIQQVDPKGAKYTKKDVEPLLKKAREAMSKKGILADDLPAQAAGLEKEATKAMADGDYGPARFAAQQLQATVEGIKVDRGFIGAKIGRLSKLMKGKTLDDAKQKEVEDLFSDATAKYGDGDYAGANKKLNAIYREIS